LTDLYDGNISINPTERKEHRRRASQKLEIALSQRPTPSDLADRNILINEHDNFNEKIQELMLLIDRSQNLINSTKSKMFGVTDEIKSDYIQMSTRLHDQIFEYKQTLNQFQADVHSREQRLRTDLETKQRVLLHMNGISEQQKHDANAMKAEYEEKLRVLQEKLDEQKGDDLKGDDQSGDMQKLQVQIKQYLDAVRNIGNGLQSELLAYTQQSGNHQRYNQLQQQKNQMNGYIDRLFSMAMTAMSSGGSSASTSASANQGLNDQSQHEQKIAGLESKMKKQEQQIKKLRHQKKEMVKMVNEKMTDLKYYHQQELQKERQIANVLVANEKKKYEALLERTGAMSNQNRMNNQQNYEMMQMRQQIERMKQIMSKTLAENDSLKKSKKSLEKMVMKLSTDIVQTANKR